MRIVHLSDIHLSKENLSDFKGFYVENLLEDLKYFHCDKPIDVAIIRVI